MAKYQNIFFLLFLSLVVFACSMFVCVCSSSLILTSVVLTGLSWGAVLTEREEQQEQSEDSNISCQSFPHLQKNLANRVCVWRMEMKNTSRKIPVTVHNIVQFLWHKDCFREEINSKSTPLCDLKQCMTLHQRAEDFILLSTSTPLMVNVKEL